MSAVLVQIPPAEVQIHPASFVDRRARLFWWKGQLYRGVKDPRAALYVRLFKDGVIQSLVDKGLLIDSALTNLSLDGYDLVIKHESVPFVSYPYEWCGEMLKDVALLIADLRIALSQHGLALQDGHALNVLFRGCRPVFVDFGSIVPEDEASHEFSYDEFRRFVINPLRLIGHGQGRIARWMLHDMDKGVLDSEITALTSGRSLATDLRQVVDKTVSRSRGGLISLLKRATPRALKPLAKRQANRLASATQKMGGGHGPSRLELNRRVRSEIEDIRIPSVQTEWAGYHESEWLPLSPSEHWTPKHRTVSDVLSELRPSSVLDVAANEGWYSHLAAVLGSRVVAFDIDETALTNLYRRNKTTDLPILSLVMDLKNPSPGYGLSNQSFPAATERFGCDMVIALALVHHLVFRQYLDFDQIVDALGAFSKRWLLLEFVSAEDQFVKTWSPESRPWYNLDTLVAAVERRFHSVKILRSFPEPRVILLCEK